MLVAALCVSFLVGAGHAWASGEIAIDAPSPSAESRTELNLGFMVGGGDVGLSKRYQRGVSLDVGRRFDDWVLLAQYAYLGVGRPESDATGSMTRLGLLARYSLVRTHHQRRDGSPLSGDYWVEAGAGVERIAWHGGGTLTRPDIAIGVGVQLDAVIRRTSDAPSWLGPYLGFRAVIAREPDRDSEAMPTCTGVCNRDTVPSQNDTALFFVAGLNWGH